MTFFVTDDQRNMVPKGAKPASAGPEILDELPAGAQILDALPAGSKMLDAGPTRERAPEILDALPEGSVEIQPGPTVDRAGPVKREIGFGEGAQRGALDSLASVPEFVNRAIAQAIGLFDSGAKEAFSERMVAPLANVRQQQQLNPETEELTLGGQLGQVTGTLARDLPLALAGGGVASLFAKGAGTALPAAETAGTFGSALRTVAPEMAKGAAAMTPSAMIEAADTYRELRLRGVDPQTAAAQSGLAAFAYQAFGALPLSASSAAKTLPGRMASRAATGAALAAPTVEAERNISNAIYGDNYPELRRDFSIEDTIVNSVPAAIMAAILGPASRPSVTVRFPKADGDPRFAPSGADPFSIAQSDPTLNAWLQANNITGADDPRFAALQDRLAARQAADEERAGRPRQEPMSTEDRNAIDDGVMDAAAEGAAGYQAAPLPDQIAVDSQGRADVGDLGVRAGVELRGKSNALVPVERPATDPEPKRLTPEEIRRSRAGMLGGTENAAEPPPRMVAPEGRQPQTPDQVQEQRQAGQAFTLADRQRGKAGPDVADTQPVPRPEGRGETTVMLEPVKGEDGQIYHIPVEILARRTVPDKKGNVHTIVTVRRYDPRTGEPAPDAVPYEIPEARLRSSQYAVDPRMSQDFVERAKSPAGKAMGYPEQTYRTTPPDPTVEGAEGPTSPLVRPTQPRPEDRSPTQPFSEHAPRGGPDARATRSPFPEQPPGRGPWPDWSSAEAEFVAREAARRAREEARRAREEAGRQYDEQYQDEGQSAKAKAEQAYRGAKFSNEPHGRDNAGRWVVDEFGFVRSTKGGPMKFANHQQAARWILKKGQSEENDQLFEIENHPSGNGFAVRERGRAEGPKEPPPGSKGNENAQGRAGTSKPEGQANAAPPRGLPGPKAEQPNVIDEPTPAPKNEARAAPEPEPFTLEPDAPAAPRQPRPSPAPGGGRRPSATGPYGPVPKRPRSLWEFVRDNGGLEDDTFTKYADTAQGRRAGRMNPSDIRRMIDGDKRFIGLTRSIKRTMLGKRTQGFDADDMALKAWESGYFPEFEDRPHVNEFLAALADDMDETAPRRSVNDTEAGRAYDDAIKANEEIDRLAAEYGIDHSEMTPDQFADAIAERKSFDELYDDVRAHDRDTELQQMEAERRAKEWLADQGESWEPDAVYSDEPITQAEFERYVNEGPQIDTESAYEGGYRPEVAARDSEPVSERGQEDGGGRHSESGARKEPAQEPVTEEVDTLDGLRDQYVVPGAERAGDDAVAANQRKADKAFAEQAVKGKKRGRAAQENADEGLFEDKSKPKPADDMFDDKLYSGGVFDPDVWKAMAKAVPMPRKSMEAWASHAREFADDVREAHKGGGSPWRWAANIGMAVGYHADGEMRTIAERYNSDTLKSIPDMIFAKAGRDTGQKLTFDEAVSSTINKRLTAMQRILAPLEQDREKMQQVATLVQNPGAIRPGTPIHDAAAGLTKLLREQLGYLKDAGIDIGEVRSGYFPRVINQAAVHANPDGFKAAAARAIRISKRVSSSDAKAQAEVWANHIIMGQHEGLSTPLARVGGDIEANFLKGRQLGKQADEILKEFYIRDPREALTRYFTQGVRRAEIARRFGDAWSKWSELESKIVKEDARAAEALEGLRNYVRTVAGVNPPGVSATTMSAMAWLRTWSTISLLEKATLSSLGEIVLPAFRTGNMLDAFRSIKNAGEALARTKDAKARRAFAEDIGVITSSFLDATISAARWANDPGARLQTKVQQKFFTRTGLEQWTAGTRAWSVDVGRTFVRRLAKEVVEGGSVNRSSAFYLRELGVQKGQERAFAEWVLGKNDGRPDIADLTGEFGEAYRTAMIRFADQTIMRPSASTRPRWAAHPLLGLPFAIQSYNFAFQENVLNRMARLARSATKSDNEFGALDRARVVLGPFAGMALLVAVQGLMSEARDELLGDPVRRKEQDQFDRGIKIASRAGVFGALDPLVNAVTGARYQRDLGTSLAGPVVGRMLSAGDRTIQALTSTSDTNNASRKMAQTLYDLVIEPSVNLALTALPGTSLVAAGLTQAAGAGQTREAFTSALAGKKETRGGSERPGRQGREGRESRR